MNIARTPYNGRNFEYFGEDPFLASQTAVAVIRGIQDNPVVADAKHYALNNQEIDRMTVDVRVDERTMREIYLPAFEASVKKARRRLGDVRVQQGQQASTPARTRRCSPSTCATTGASTGSSSPTGAPCTRTAASANAGLDLEMHAFAMPAPGDAGDRHGWPVLRRRPAQGRDVERVAVEGPPRRDGRATSSGRCSAQGLFDQRTDQNAVSFTADVSTPAHQAHRPPRGR